MTDLDPSLEPKNTVPTVTPKRPLSKSPIWPALMSAIVAPGFGQILNREYAKGIFLLSVFLGSFAYFTRIVFQQLSLHLTIDPEHWENSPVLVQQALTKIVQENPSMFLTFQLLLVIVWVYSIVDAYLSARKKWKSNTAGSL